MTTVVICSVRMMSGREPIATSPISAQSASAVAVDVYTSPEFSRLLRSPPSPLRLLRLMRCMSQPRALFDVPTNTPHRLHHH